MNNKLFIAVLCILWSSALYAQDYNLYYEFQKVKENFPHQELTDISTLSYYIIYGDSCQLKKSNTELSIPELGDDMTDEMTRQSSLFKNTGHLFSFKQFNDDIILVIIAVHGRYSIPSSILFTINKSGKIVGEVKTSSVFFDAGEGEVIMSAFEKNNMLYVTIKDLDERPEDLPCEAEIRQYKISELGLIELFNIESKTIECSEE